MILYPYEQLDEIFSDLSEQAQDFIMSPKVQDTVDYIISNYNLTVNPEDFKRAVFTVLVCKWTTEDFRDYILNELHVSEDDADDMLVDLDSVLEPLWDIIEKSSQETQTSSTPTSLTPARAPAQPLNPNPVIKLTPTPRPFTPDTSEHPVPLIPKEPLPPMNVPSQPSQAPRPTQPLQHSEPIVVLPKQPQAPTQAPDTQPKAPSGPQSILDSRLNSQTNLPKQEFSVDPYREPPAP